MNDIIEKIALEKLGSVPKHISAILHKGVVNKIYKVDVDRSSYIFRLNKKEIIKDYLKEKWCMEKAAESRIPVSVCYHVGEYDDVAYMILNYIEGVNGSNILDDRDQERIYETLGQYATKFNSIRTTGFGIYIENMDIGFNESWNDFYPNKINKIFGDGLLINKNIITKKQSQYIQDRLSEMKDWDYEPHLCHGNLDSSNTIVTETGEIFLIDWGNGAGNVAPHLELADIIVWRSTRKYLQSFLNGYGISNREFEEMEHDINNMLTIQLLDLIRWSFREGKHLNNIEFIMGSVERIMNFK